MAYIKPYIDASGVHVPTYVDVRDDLIAAMKGIYGQDIYLEPDAQDYQMISVYADKFADLVDFGVLLYNNRGPGTAIGGGLDGVVKANGIRRKGAGHSIVTLTVKGTPGTVITNGKACDKAGYQWTITGTVTIPATGMIDVQAMCDTVGRIYADPGSISRIMTPTQGWMSVNNSARAITGSSIEKDSELRSRQTISTARPSRTVLLGTIGGLAELPDVTRYRVYENDTNIFGYYGEPIEGHSISVVIEGGDDHQIAEEIYHRKTPGCGTYGDIEVDVLSFFLESVDQTAEGMIIYEDAMKVPPIRFFRPRYVQVYVEIKVSAKPGFVTQTQSDIVGNVVAYLNSLRIGSDLILSALYAPINSASKDITNPSFSVLSLRIGKELERLGDDDISILFNEVTQGVDTHVTVEVV